MFCYKCGSQVTDGDFFCASCGAPQQAAQQPIQQSVQQPIQEPAQPISPSEPIYGSTEPTMKTTEQSYSSAPEQAYTPPEQAYTPPEQVYTPPEQAYTPPEQPYTPPEQAYTPPEQAYTPPEQAYTPPEPAYTPPEQAYTPPEQAYTPPEPAYTPPEQPYTPPVQAYQPPEQPYVPPGQTYYPPENAYAGQPGAPSQPAQTYAQYQTGESAPAGKKGKGGLWWKIAVPIVVVAIAAAAVYYFVFLRNTSNILNNAMTNMREEVTQRINGTPLKVFGLLGETLKDGTVTVNVDYKDEWSGDETRVGVTLSSIMEDREFALAGDIKSYDSYRDTEQNIDFEAFINKERMAFGSKLIDNNYYGFTYSTFRDDIEEFGMSVGLSRDLMDTLSEYVEMFDEMINKEKSDGVSLDAYSAILVDFVKACDQTSERVEIDSGGATVRATQIDILITKDAILKLFNDLYDELDRDEELRDYFDTFVDSYSIYMLGADYNSLLREFSKFIDQFDDYYADSSTITLSFYIGSGDRLLRYELNTNMRIDGERIRMSMSFDFGASATDRWVLRAEAEGETMRINWDYKERSNSIENTITYSMQSETITLVSLYSPTRGDFTLSYEVDYSSGWYSDEGEITGVFTEDSNGFRLSFDNLMDPDYDETLTIEIIGEAGANIKQIDYINIDEWGKNFITDVEEAFKIGSASAAISAVW